MVELNLKDVIKELSFFKDYSTYVFVQTKTNFYNGYVVQVMEEGFMFMDDEIPAPFPIRFDQLKAPVVPSKKKEILNIHNPGEFELGGLMVRRDIGSDYYILDEDLLRVVYVGDISKDTKPESFKNLGDVDVLIMPVGDGESFPELSVIEKIVTQVEPLFLIPSAFKTSDMKSGQDLSSVDDFVKHAGYTNVRREKTLSVSGSVEKEVRNMDIVILE